MSRVSFTGFLKGRCHNSDGVTFLMALFMVMIIGIMLGLTGQSWKTIMQREREKELLFRGSQIKEAIENWYDAKYSVNGVKWGANHPLMKLEDLLQNPYSLTPLRYLPQSYDAKVDSKGMKCGSECAGTRLYQDPMTGKEWTIIRDATGISGYPAARAGAQGGGIIGVASKSDDEPFKKDFKDTALENMGTMNIGTATGAAPTVTMPGGFGTDAAPAGSGKLKKYSEWKFVADPKNDHKKIERAYHEGW